MSVCIMLSEAIKAGIMFHTTAVHLLESGVDVNVIRVGSATSA